MPGTGKAPEALREAGLFRRLEELGAIDDGVVVAGRYVDAVQPGHVRNEAAIVDHSRRLAARIRASVEAGRAPLVLGGDCSIVLGAGLAFAGHDRGIAYLDGHTDFRHPGNHPPAHAVGGEALAAVTGRHHAAIADIDGLAPYFDPRRAVQLGCRADDADLELVRGLIGAVVTAPEVALDTDAAAGTAVEVAEPGFWLHLDVDILDALVMPAVDSPDPGGLTADDLIRLLRALAPHAVGADVCIFDPDLDADGRYARLLTDIVVAGFAELGSAVTRRAR